MIAPNDPAEVALIHAGNELLPMYYQTFHENVADAFNQSVLGMGEAIIKCQSTYRTHNHIDKAMVCDMLEVTGCAYSGNERAADTGFVKLSTAELPPVIRPLYNESNGIFTATKGLRVWLGRRGNAIAVSYSGTDPKNVDMVSADIVQLSSPSTLYLKGAGLLKILLAHFADKDFLVTGHSLGGGLTQFCVTANIDARPAGGIVGYAFNPAGLSGISLSYLGPDRLRRAKDSIFAFRTRLDIVSLGGGVVGTFVTLPMTQHNGHSMTAVRSCLKRYC